MERLASFQSTGCRRILASKVAALCSHNFDGGPRALRAHNRQHLQTIQIQNLPHGELFKRGKLTRAAAETFGGFFIAAHNGRRLYMFDWPEIEQSFVSQNFLKPIVPMDIGTLSFPPHPRSSPASMQPRILRGRNKI